MWFWRASLVSLTISSQRRTDDEHNDRNRSTTAAYGNGWENIEKHLSMKKTIRKKMMRDLQQAFVDSQNLPDQQWNHVQMAPSNHKSGEPNLLEMLKANPATATPKSNQMTENQKIEPAPTKKPGFWKKLTTRKNKRWLNPIQISKWNLRTLTYTASSVTIRQLLFESNNWEKKRWMQ